MTYKELNETMTEDAFRLKRILAQMEHFKMVGRKVSGRYYLTPEYRQACQGK
ncbi:TPA: hypothetical protein PXP79_001591 [Yersinia enterocolitica]|nr:hypothetical protein [Yersinia enterocolitica]